MHELRVWFRIEWNRRLREPFSNASHIGTRPPCVAPAACSDNSSHFHTAVSVWMRASLIGGLYLDVIRAGGLVIDQPAVDDGDLAGLVDQEAAAGVVGQRIGEHRA